MYNHIHVYHIINIKGLIFIARIDIWLYGYYKLWFFTVVAALDCPCQNYYTKSYYFIAFPSLTSKLRCVMLKINYELKGVRIDLLNKK